jgi:hypothetical protein
MATNEVHTVSCNVGAITNGVLPLMYVPSGYGGVTILGAKYVGAGAGTSWVTLDDLGTAGTSSATRLGSGGTVVNTAGVPNAITLGTTVYVSAGHYIGIKENNIGALNASTVVTINYVWGK